MLPASPLLADTILQQHKPAMNLCYSRAIMILAARIEEKTTGNKLLLKDCRLVVPEGVKIGIIGRNGAGKSTLFRILNGQDHEFSGSVERKKGAQIVLTEQEHFNLGDTTALEYIRDSLPRYQELKEIVRRFQEGLDTGTESLNAYSNAEAEFGERRYYDVEDRIVTALAAYGIPEETCVLTPFARLSGGQKRFAELVRISLAEADLALLDEPTNHMDYVGKDQFITWLKDTGQAVCLISHDRDVLQYVDEILELKDHALHRFPGNYAAYLRQNGTSTITQVNRYEEDLKRLERIHTQWMLARARKNAAKSDAGRNNAKTQEERLEREHKELHSTLKKPSFWIDRETLASTRPTLIAGYHKYKDKTIRIDAGHLDEHDHELLKADQLSLGYQEPLFENLSFAISHGDRLHIKGRNGAGKSTLLRAIMASAADETPESWCFAGRILTSPKVRIGIYEQEVPQGILGLTLGEAVRELHLAEGLSPTDQQLRNILAAYLFNPIEDSRLQVSQLSGGQKARLQLIGMLCGSPNLLILDEPTNHLDLPSIEELERALAAYEGAILVVSHDSLFIRNLKAETISV
jgi:ATP-binding cassette subfamily F protein 3